VAFEAGSAAPAQKVTLSLLIVKRDGETNASVSDLTFFRPYMRGRASTSLSSLWQMPTGKNLKQFVPRHYRTPRQAASGQASGSQLPPLRPPSGKSEMVLRSIPSPSLILRHHNAVIHVRMCTAARHYSPHPYTHTHQPSNHIHYTHYLQLSGRRRTRRHVLLHLNLTLSWTSPGAPLHTLILLYKLNKLIIFAVKHNNNIVFISTNNSQNIHFLF
jgi:hypothetical protein